MKKGFLFIIALVFAFFAFCGFYAKADAEITITMEAGASIRLIGDQGLRFAATASEDFDGATEHGFYLAIGNHTKEEMIAAIAGGSGLIDGKKLVKKDTTGTDKSFAVTIIEMPESYYGTEITAIAYYVKDTANVYSDIASTRNVITVAKAMADGGSENATVIGIANTAKVKVTGADTSISYYADIDNQLVIKEGDTIELAAGTYNNLLTIDKNNVKIYGPNKNNNDFDNRAEEAIFTSQGIYISGGVSGLEVNGIKISGAAVILGDPEGNISNLTISNCNFIDITKTRAGYSGPLYFGTTGAKNLDFVISYNNFRNDAVNGNSIWNNTYASTRAETAIYVQDVENFEFCHNNVYNFFNGIEVNTGGVVNTGLAGVVSINNNVFYNYVQLALQIRKYNVSTLNICDNIFNDVKNDGSDTAGAIRLYAEGSNTGQVVNIIGNDFIDAWGWHMIRVTFNPSKSTVNIKYNLFQSNKNSSSTIYVIQNQGEESDVNAGYNCYLVEDGSAVSDLMLANLGTVTSAGANYSTKDDLDVGYDAYLNN